MQLDFELLNNLLHVFIGVGIFIMLSCFTYIVRNIFQGLIYLDKVDTNNRNELIKSLVKKEISKNGKPNYKD